MSVWQPRGSARIAIGHDACPSSRYPRGEVVTSGSTPTGRADGWSANHQPDPLAPSASLSAGACEPFRPGWGLPVSRLPMYEGDIELPLAGDIG